MKKINVFIASSNDEKEDREALKEMLFQFNEISKIYNIEINPIMWELLSKDFKSKLSPKQTDYNQALKNSNIALFIFGKRVGKYTLEEFNLACDEIKKGRNIKVFSYFKNVDLGSIENIEYDDIEGQKSILELKDNIKEIGQVFGSYEKTTEILTIMSKEIFSSAIKEILHENNNSEYLFDLIKLCKEINQPYQAEQKEKIIEDCYNSLYFLSKYNFTPKLDQTTFYELCHQILSTARCGSTINAVSLMLKCEWNDSKEEISFWEDNKAAVNRRAKLERIFIVNRNQAHRLMSNSQIKNHISLENKSKDIVSYVVEKEKLQRVDPTLLEEAGNGFILIDSERDHIALLDESPISEIRAKPIVHDERLNEIQKTFENIKKYAIPIIDYINQIPLSHCKKEMISIFVTTKCNLNCDYCFTNKNEGSHKNQTIPLNFVKKGIDDYFKTDYLRHIRFFGAGEPTTEIELIKKICKYAKEKSKNTATFEIQTNGAFNDQIALWLKENIDIIWISCDGTPDIQDKHRPFLNDKRLTSTVIEKNIKLLLKNESKTFVGIRATITSENIFRQIEMIDYFYNLGIRDVWVDPIFPAVGEKNISNSNFDMMEFANEFLAAAEYANKKGMFYGSILTCNFNDSVNKHCRACLPVPHLTTDGYVSACDMALFGNDQNHMSPLIYGEWNEKTKKIIYSDDKKNRIKSRTTENMKHCETCSAKEHCGGYCLGEVLNETNDLFGQKEHTCKAIRFLDKKMNEEIRKYSHTHP